MDKAKRKKGNQRGQALPPGFMGRRAPAARPDALSGQALPIDFMGALFIFLVMFALFLILWDMHSARYFSHSIRTADEIAAISVSDQLAGFQGSPENWAAAPESAAMIGLARTPGELDGAKMAALQSLSYADAKRIFGFERDFFIKVEDLLGVRYAESGVEPGNATRAIEASRAAAYNGTTVFVRVMVYE